MRSAEFVTSRRLLQLPSTEPIISFARGKTEVYKARFPNPIIQVHTDDSLLQHWIKALGSMEWEAAWSYAYEVYHFGECLDLPPTGIMLLTPDMTTAEVQLARTWSAADPAQRTIYDLRQQNLRRTAPLIRFDDLRPELEFLKQHPAAIHHTHNPTVRACTTRCGRSEWNIPEQALYSLQMIGMTFCEMVDHVAPYHDEVYASMYAVGQVVTSPKYFAPALRRILDTLRYPGSEYAAFVSDRPVLLPGFDVGNWPAQQSRAGRLLEGLLRSSGVAATRADRGYGAHRWHSWGLGLRAVEWLAGSTTYWGFFCQCFGGLACPLLLEWWVSRWGGQMGRALGRISSRHFPPTTLRRLATWIDRPEKYAQQYVLRLQRTDPVYRYVACTLRDQSTDGLLLNYTQYARAIHIIRCFRSQLAALATSLQPTQTYISTRWSVSVAGYALSCNIERVYQMADHCVLVYFHLGGRDLSGWVAWVGKQGVCTSQELPPLPRETFVCTVQGCKHVKPRDFSKYVQQWQAQY